MASSFFHLPRSGSYAELGPPGQEWTTSPAGSSSLVTSRDGGSLVYMKLLNSSSPRLCDLELLLGTASVGGPSPHISFQEPFPLYIHPEVMAPHPGPPSIVPFALLVPALRGPRPCR